MPPAAYWFLHADPRLSATDMERLASGLAKTMAISAAEARDEQER